MVVGKVLDGRSVRGGRCGCPSAVGQLQDEPWGILPPEVVHHGGEFATDAVAMHQGYCYTVALDVERVWFM